MPGIEARKHGSCQDRSHCKVCCSGACCISAQQYAANLASTLQMSPTPKPFSSLQPSCLPCHRKVFPGLTVGLVSEPPSQLKKPPDDSADAASTGGAVPTKSERQGKTNGFSALGKCWWPRAGRTTADKQWPAATHELALYKREAASHSTTCTSLTWHGTRWHAHAGRRAWRGR